MKTIKTAYKEWNRTLLPRTNFIRETKMLRLWAIPSIRIAILPAIRLLGPPPRLVTSTFSRVGHSKSDVAGNSMAPKRHPSFLKRRGVCLSLAVLSSILNESRAMILSSLDPISVYLRKVASSFVSGRPGLLFFVSRRGERSEKGYHRSRYCNVDLHRR